MIQIYLLQSDMYHGVYIGLGDSRQKHHEEGEGDGFDEFRH